MLVAIGGEHITLAHFLLHHLVVGNIRRRGTSVADEPAFVGLVGERRATTIHIVSVHGAIPRMPLGVLVVDRGAQLLAIAPWSPFLEQSVEEHRSELLVALFGEVEPVDGERFSTGSGVTEHLQRRMEQVHKLHVIGIGDVRHSRGVEL